jgi:hypothetical protein
MTMSTQIHAQDAIRTLTNALSMKPVGCIKLWPNGVSESS